MNPWIGNLFWSASGLATKMITNVRIHPFLILLLIGMPLIVAGGPMSHYSFAAGEHRITATIDRQESEFGENAALTFRSYPDGNLLITVNSDGFEAPVLCQNRGENFVHVSTIPAGSGAFVSDIIFWIAPDGTMHEIEFENAAEAYEDKVEAQETVLTGGPGVYCEADQLKFEFYIAHNGDTHCCPTAGKVTGNYTIAGEKTFDILTNSYSSTFKMVAGPYSRSPVSASEIYASSR